MRKVISLLFFFLSVIFAHAQNSLNEYIQSALKNSPVFADAKNQASSLGLDSMLIRAAYKPQINFNSTDIYAPTINGFGYDQVNTNGGFYSALVGANLTVVGKNNLNNKFSSLTIQKQILELNSKLNERDLKQAVTAQYLTIYGEQQILLNEKKVLDVLKQEDVILKNIAEKGIYRQTDYLSFLVSYKQQQISYSQQKLQAKNDVYLLNYLCGIIDTSYIILAEPSITISQTIANEHSVQYRQFFLDSMQLQNSVEQLKYNYKPKLNLFADAGYNTSFLYHAERNFGTSVGLNFIVPIYNGNQRKTQLNKIKLSENTRLNYAEFFKKQYSMKQIQLLQQISEIEKLIAQAKDQLKISETLLQANNKELEIGDLRIADYIISLTNYISSQITAQQLATSKLQLINQFNYLNY